METDELLSLYAEVVIGVPVERSSLPKTVQVAAQRARLVEQVAALRLTMRPGDYFDVRSNY